MASTTSRPTSGDLRTRAGTPARELPAGQAGGAADVTVAEEPSTAEEIGGILLGSVLMSVWLVYGPLFAIGGGVYEAHLHSAFKSASAQVLMVLPQPEEVVRKALGPGDVRFELPKAGTTVLAYNPKSDRRCTSAFVKGRPCGCTESTRGSMSLLSERWASRRRRPSSGSEFRRRTETGGLTEPHLLRTAGALLRK